MFAKIAAVIVALGLVACMLLALRQARLQAANELAEARLRVRTIDERVSLVRAEIARRVTPSQVEEMTRESEPTLGPLVPPALAAEQTRRDAAQQGTGAAELVAGKAP